MTGGTKLRDISLVDMLPDSIKNDPNINAMARAIDPYLWDVIDTTEQVLIWSRIDELEEPLLSNLARQLGITAYDGWILADTIERKRELVALGYQVHFLRGTRFALESVFDILGIPGTIVEWWEPGGEEYSAYEFSIDFDLANMPADAAFWTNAIKIVYALKNERSHLRAFKYNINVDPALVYTGAANVILANTFVYPITLILGQTVDGTAYASSFPVVTGNVQIYPG